VKYSKASAIEELGVGINLMPQATTSFDEIGMLPALEQCGIAQGEQAETCGTQLAKREGQVPQSADSGLSGAAVGNVVDYLRTLK